MKVEEKGHTVAIKDTKGNLNAFNQNIQTEYNSFKEKNIILDLSANGKLTLQQVLSFLELSNMHREAKKSFVLVVSDFNYNDAPEEMVVVPTLLEAHDIIQMEEIERDLGF
jgi:hypothetical protein